MHTHAPCTDYAIAGRRRRRVKSIKLPTERSLESYVESTHLEKGKIFAFLKNFYYNILDFLIQCFFALKVYNLKTLVLQAVSS
jgi:hypothetical protein